MAEVEEYQISRNPCFYLFIVRLLYMALVYFPFLDLYSLAYKPLPCTCNILLIYTKTQVFLNGIRAGSLIFFLIFRCSHGLGITATV